MNDITRDIILDVTEKLIYRHGIAATGMDFLVKTRRRLPKEHLPLFRQ